MSTHPHYHQHPPPPLQGAAPYTSYATPPSADTYGYAGSAYHPARQGNESHPYSRPRATHSQSHSSGSGSSGAAHESVGGSHYAPHYTSSFPAQYGPYSTTYFPSQTGSAPHSASTTSHQSYQYAEHPVQVEGQEHASETSAIDDDVDDHGVLSIFIISRSNCAFVNYATSTHLDRAVKYFQGKQVRPRDTRCPKLVCRVRKKDDEAQAGVAGQRGRGIHVAWLKQQRELERAQNASTADRNPSETSSQPSSDVLTSPLKDTQAVAAGLTSAASYSSSGSASYASTNSSLFRHPAFRHRFFILKSLRADDLDRSVETGYWATQPHNENVLDQAYRNSETVFLIFGVNQTGQFHGYAKMAGPIHTSTNDSKEKEEQVRRASQASTLSVVTGNLSATAVPDSVDEKVGESHIVASPLDAEARSHPTLDKRDIEAARGLFGALVVDGVLDARGQPMTSPLPITPNPEEGAFEKSLSMSPQRDDTITPQNADAYVQSSTWPYTSTKSTISGNNTSESDKTERPKLGSALSADRSSARVAAESDEHGVRRMDMEPDSSQTSSSLNDQPSLAPSDSASWSSADPRVAEQIALRAVIHNLRLDEMESRGQAERLESKLRSTPGHTDDDTTGKGEEAPPSQGDEPRSPPRQSSSDSWGKPFRVEWVRTDPLPFQRVKRLRNPWRDNRQVKVSRDGTELEPGVGRQLLEEWNRLHAPALVDSTKASSKVADTSPSSAGRNASDEDE
uniref:YTH domain-containing protein n=1 Tax=Kalmanozyma brasiliensis (strain GHG001) TaxID=1365824 RepID=V5F1H8_KALBG